MSRASHKLSVPEGAAARATAELRDAILDKLTYACAKNAATASDLDWYVATVLAVRDRIVDRWMDADRRTEREHKKRVYYLSVEYLIGRLLFDPLTNLRNVEPARAALASFGVNFDLLRKLEAVPVLGNG